MTRILNILGLYRKIKQMLLKNFLIYIPLVVLSGISGIMLVILNKDSSFSPEIVANASEIFSLFSKDMDYRKILLLKKVFSFLKYSDSFIDEKFLDFVKKRIEETQQKNKKDLNVLLNKLKTLENFYEIFEANKQKEISKLEKDLDKTLFFYKENFEYKLAGDFFQEFFQNIEEVETYKKIDNLERINDIFSLWLMEAQNKNYKTNLDFHNIKDQEEIHNFILKKKNMYIKDLENYLKNITFMKELLKKDYKTFLLEFKNFEKILKFSDEHKDSIDFFNSISINLEEIDEIKKQIEVFNKDFENIKIMEFNENFQGEKKIKSYIKKIEEFIENFFEIETKAFLEKTKEYKLDFKTKKHIVICLLNLEMTKELTKKFVINFKELNLKTHITADVYTVKNEIKRDIEITDSEIRQKINEAFSKESFLVTENEKREGFLYTINGKIPDDMIISKENLEKIAFKKEFLPLNTRNSNLEKYQYIFDLNGFAFNNKIGLCTKKEEIKFKEISKDIIEYYKKLLEEEKRQEETFEKIQILNLDELKFLGEKRININTQSLFFTNGRWLLKNDSGVFLLIIKDIDRKNFINLLSEMNPTNKESGNSLKLLETAISFLVKQDETIRRNLIDLIINQIANE